MNQQELDKARKKNVKEGGGIVSFSDVLIELAASFAFNGTKANFYKAGETDTIRALLNEAWRKFIIDRY